MDSSATVQLVINTIIVLLPFLLCFTFGSMLLELWIEYKKKSWLSKQKTCLLEIRLPKEINKSPLAMELLLTALHMTGGDSNNLWDKITIGKCRPWFSFEMVSMGGSVKFFIWTRANLKKFIESQVYSQYPGAEVTEVPDYTTDIHLDESKNGLWACDFELAKSSVYPIKSYADYNLDKDPKEEMKVDPITPVLEFMGAMRQGEQLWIQIIAKAHKKEDKKPGSWFEQTDLWKDDAKKEIEDVRKKATPDSGGDFPGFPNPTKGQNEMISAIERNTSKPGFDVGIRALYIADKDLFDPANIAGLTGVFKQYNSDMLNGFKMTRVTSFDYPWQDFRGKKLSKMKKTKLQLYKWREYFNESEKDTKTKYALPFVLNTESLATIYHFPGNVAQTPTFARVLSKKGEPPSNLPI